MAGIGFVLRNLTSKDDLLGFLSGFGYSAMVATGPWLFTILALTGILSIGSLFTTFEEQTTFRIIIIYNFSFSLVLSGPVVMVVTRYVADQIYAKDVRAIPGTLLGGLALLYCYQVPLAGVFYLLLTDLDLITQLAAMANYFLINGIWLVAVFITALKDYKLVMRIFLVGMAFGAVANAFLARKLGLTGMLIGFNGGLLIILFGLTARVFSEYPYDAAKLFGFLGYFRKYWDLAISGLTFNLAAWADKWLMWFSDESKVLAGAFVSYPDYDGAMFMAYLSIVPSMASFVMSMETQFYEHYLKFYRDIQKHVSLDRILANHRAIIAGVHESGRNFFVLQGSISLLGILLAPRIFEWFGVNFLQLSIFRLGILGSFYHVGILFLGILLSYFDFRRAALAVSLGVCRA